MINNEPVIIQCDQCDQSFGFQPGTHVFSHRCLPAPMIKCLNKKISRLIAALKKLSVYGDRDKWEARRRNDFDILGRPFSFLEYVFTIQKTIPWLTYEQAIESVKDILDE